MSRRCQFCNKKIDNRNHYFYFICYEEEPGPYGSSDAGAYFFCPTCFLDFEELMREKNEEDK